MTHEKRKRQVEVTENTVLCVDTHKKKKNSANDSTDLQSSLAGQFLKKKKKNRKKGEENQIK